MINKTITYVHKKKSYQVNLSNGNGGDFYMISVDNVICSCATSKELIHGMDKLIKRAINRLNAELKVGIKPVLIAI